METYEIRVLRFDGSPGLITQQQYLSADAAIAAARILAGSRPFEVWNDERCVYTGLVKATSAARTPARLRV